MEYISWSKSLPLWLPSITSYVPCQFFCVSNYLIDCPSQFIWVRAGFVSADPVVTDCFQALSSIAASQNLPAEDMLRTELARLSSNISVQGAVPSAVSDTLHTRVDGDGNVDRPSSQVPPKASPAPERDVDPSAHPSFTRQSFPSAAAYDDVRMASPESFSLSPLLSPLPSPKPRKRTPLFLPSSPEPSTQSLLLSPEPWGAPLLLQQPSSVSCSTGNAVPMPGDPGSSSLGRLPHHSALTTVAPPAPKAILHYTREYSASNFSSIHPMCFWTQAAGMTANMSAPSPPPPALPSTFTVEDLNPASADYATMDDPHLADELKRRVQVLCNLMCDSPRLPLEYRIHIQSVSQRAHANAKRLEEVNEEIRVCFIKAFRLASELLPGFVQQPPL